MENRAWSRLLLCSVVVLAAGPDALSSPQEIKGSIVTVVVGAVGAGNAPVSSQGTGFFINSDGYLVTAYHLLGQLGVVSKGSVTYTVYFGSTSASSVRALPLYFSPEADLMVLAAPTSDVVIKPLQRSSSGRGGIVAGKTPVFTGGYPAGSTFVSDQGIIKSFGMVNPPALWWMTSMTFQNGQSGSPIINERDEVVGIAKGVDVSNSAVGFIIPSGLVPSNYWESGKLNSRSTLDSLVSKSVSQFFIQLTPSQPTRLERVREFDLTNGKCDLSRPQIFEVSADAGGKIDPSSVKVHVITLEGSMTSPVVAANEASISVSTLLTNSGFCGS